MLYLGKLPAKRHKNWFKTEKLCILESFCIQSDSLLCRGVSLTKKLTATLAVCAILLFCVIAAGCSGQTASPTPSTANNSTMHATQATSSNVTVSTQVTPSPSPSATIATPTPSASPTASSSPSAVGTAGYSVLFYYLPDCSHCAKLESSASFNQLQSEVPVSWIVWQGTNNYNVKETPTLILLQNGGEVNRWVGVEDATAILAYINGG